MITATMSSNSEKGTLLPKPKMVKQHHLEFYVYFVFFVIGQTLIEAVWTNAVEAFYCRYTWDVRHSTCFNGSDIYLEKAQKFASTIQFLSNTGSSLTAPFLLLFAGPWSDIHGRKFLILMPTFGYLVQCLLWLYASTLDKINPWLVLLFFLPYYLTGGNPMTLFAGCCCICDLTREENRSFSLGVLQGSILLGSVIGNLLSTVLVKQGYVVVFSVASFFVFLASVDAALLIKETVSVYEKLEKLGSCSKNIFRMKFLKEIAECFRKQTGKTGRMLVIIVIARFVYVLTTNGQNSVEYLFLQWKWNITLQEYAVMNTLSDVFQGTSVWVVTLFLKNRVGDLCMLTHVMILELIAVMPFVIGRQKGLMYLGVGISSLDGLFVTFYKSFLSKIVDKDDIGKILTVTDIGESFSLILGVFIYTTLYQMTLLTFPAAVYVVAILGCITTLNCLWIVMRMNS